MGRTKRSWWDLSRANAVTTRVLVLSLAVLYPVLVIVPPVVAWVRGRPLEWETTLAEGGPQVPGFDQAGVLVTYGDVATWRISDPTVLQRLVALVPVLLTAVLLALGCGVAWRLVGAARRQEPFDLSSVHGLRMLAVVIVAYGVLEPWSRLMASLVITWSIDPVGSLAIPLDLSTIGVPLVVGLLVLVVAECFRTGVALRDDVSGLV